MNQDPLQQSLRELAAEQASQRPSGHVEAALLQAVRDRAGRRKQRAFLGGLAAAAALAVAVWAGFQLSPTAPPPEAESAPAPLVTEFVPLDFGLTDPGVVTTGRLTRVILPPTAPREMGFPIPPDTLPNGVQADLLLSEDGTPQAVRFVLPYRP